MSKPAQTARSLSRKLTLPLVLVGLGLSLLGIAGIYAIVSNQMEARLRLRAETIAQSIAYAAENIEHVGALQRIISATGAERETALLLVAGGRTHHILASSNPTWRNRPLTLDTTGAPLHLYEKITQGTWRAIGMDPRKLPAHWLVVSLPLQLHDWEYSSIDTYPSVALVALDTSSTRVDVWRFTALVAGGFILTLLALCTLHYVNLRRIVLLPLQEIAQHHLGATVSKSLATHMDPTDEIGQLDAALARTFAAIATARMEREQIEFAINQHVIIGATDARGQIVYANDRLCNVSGYTRNELIGQNHRMLNSGHHPKAYFTDLYQTLFQGHVWHGEICNQAKNGTLYWVDTTIVPEFGDDGKPVRYVSLCSDITERKAAEDELRQTNAQLHHAIEHANQLTHTAELATIAKADFLANMSHEIRTPMNGVIGMVGLLMDSPLSAEQRQYASVARASGESLLTIINDILDFSKIEAGQLTLETIDLNLSELLAEVVPTLALRAHEKGLEFLYDIAASVPTRIKGDPVRLRQVITNLLSNAIKFTRQGEVMLSVTPTRITPTEVVLQFAVTDTGPGIPADKIPLLFTKFTQVDTSTTRKFGGTGLGLAICKQLAELMGGEVGVNSDMGKGAEFWFTARFDRQNTSAPVSAPASSALQAAHVLVVANNPRLRTLLISRLSTWGVRNVTSTESHAGLKELTTAQAANNPFSLALIDDSMTDLANESFSHALLTAAQQSGTRLIRLIPLGQTKAPQALLAAGYAALLNKPVHAAELLNTLEACLVAPTGAVLPAAPTCASPQEVLAPASEAAVITAAAVLSPAVTAGPCRILVVDDNPTNQLVACSLLKKFGYACDAVDTGAAAIAALIAQPYELVLMDIQMPEMDGHEATQRIRQGEAGAGNCTLPIIAVTAHALSGDRDLSLAAGMNDYLIKPIDPIALKTTVARWLVAATPTTVHP